ncbi:DUF5333 family protein [Marivivens sp.]|jgi:hypothetical protein|uniref:DUF5333 family protein n=1 Tax=Marivivens sp. TaxID=1978374 RepID=UPI0017DE96D1|nr:DUF5333 family protein [Marivivens sp.]MCL7405534.1 DUF5333 domain-containing protein [Marivivens geojensis]NVK07353.1 hypothetical protein [Marivivens sp.]
MRSLFGAGFVAVWVVAGCVETQAPMTTVAASAQAAPAVSQTDRVRAGANGNRSALRSQLEIEVLDAVMPVVLAQRISRNCGRQFTFLSNKADTYYADLEEQMRDRGYSSQDFEHVVRNLPEAEAQARVISWVQERNVVITDSATWCPAGQAEIAEGTEIANFLRARG